MLRSIAPSGRPGGKISPGHNISAEDTYPKKCWIRHFLGLTHFCGETRNGRFIVKRKTQRKRMIRKLKQLRLEMRRRMHTPVKDQWQWLCAVLRGHYAYYGLAGNSRSMRRFYREVVAQWQRVLHRRSQKAKMFGPRFFKLLLRLPLPRPIITDPYRGAPVR